MMNQTIQQTTQKFIDLLPENKQYYRVDELRSWGFPSFIVQRIQVELERNLAESMILPKTDWANTQSDAVLDAWQQFVQAIRAEARLPGSFAKAVIETAVADTLDMLIEPRKNIPDVIFGSNEELEYEQLCERIQAVVVYRHFATLVPRYMQKKELTVITRDRCDQIIRRADERLTSNYSPLNWAQTLDPLFRLLDEQVDPSMLRLFFEDKGREKIAEVFDRKDELLSRAEFIEVLSSPDWAESQADPVEREQEKKSAEESYDPDRAKPGKMNRTDETGFGRQKGQKNKKRREQRFDEPEQGVREEKAVDDDTFMDPQVSADAESSSRSGNEDKSRPENENNSFTDLAASAPDPQAEDVQTLNSAFGWEEGLISFGSEEETEESTQDEASAFSPTREDPAADDIEVKGEDEKIAERDDKPIWMNFMSEEEKAALESEREEEPISGITVNERESDAGVEMDSDAGMDIVKEDDDYGEDPIGDLEGDDPAAREVDQLKEQLAGGRRRFVEDIFGGSERAYEEALKEIAMLSNWRGASKYIQKEIFQRNMVDMYSESAIDFTDRLHNFFSKKED
ncbi:hypothetical protein [Fodinibius roseus]|nr:hypothetical protein [Fodinibius roseus]